MRSFWLDLRYTLRTLRKSRGFTLAATTTLGLAMAANTTMFSVINGLLLRPLPVSHPEQIVVLSMTQDGAEGFQGFSYPDYQDLQKELADVSDVFAYTNKAARLVSNGKMDRDVVGLVTPNYFSALGIQPLAGRFIRADESSAKAAPPIVVLGYSYWQKRFARDPEVIGKQVKIDAQTLTVVGVAPKGFKGTFAFAEAAAFVPIGVPLQREVPGAVAGIVAKRPGSSREDRVISIMARLKAGVAIDQVQPALNIVARRLAEAHPEIDKGIHITAYPEQLSRPEPDPDNTMLVMAGAFTSLGVLVLLVACFNVANIFLVRAAARQRETGIRAALGAGRAQLVRQHLIESLVLAALGGMAGLLIATWTTRLLSTLPMGADMFLSFDFEPDVRVYAFAVTAVFATAFVVGLLPAMRVASTDVNAVLRGSARGFGGRSRGRLRSVLVSAQLAGSVLLLVVAGLFMRSLSSARHLDLGFNPNNVLNVTLDAEELGLDEAHGRSFFRELGERIAALPGVTSTAQAFTTPLRVFSAEAGVTVERREPVPGTQPPQIMFNMVSPGYFETLQIPMLRGRGFVSTDNEKTPAVAVINQAFADMFWGHDNPLGKRFSTNGLKGPFIEVVGVARTGQYEELFEAPKPFFYIPADQNYFAFRTIHVRTSTPSDTLHHQIEAQIHAVAPAASIPQFQEMTETLNGVNGFFFYRFGAEITAAIGLLGVTLALVGVYSMSSYAAAQRTQEIGIRMALGAEPNSVLKMVLRQSVLTIVVGLTVGLAAALAASRAISSLISGIQPTDPATFVVVGVVFSAVSLLACWAPARRVIRIDPLKALRYE